MMFGHPSQHQHMMSGVAKAVKSANTPSHLKPHLQQRLANMNMPKSGAKPQMKPKQATAFDESSTQAEQQISRPPMPFQSAKSAAMMKPGTMAMPHKGNLGGRGAMMSKGAVGGGMPGHNSKVVGGRMGTSHPSKHTDTAASLGVKPKKKSAFFGER